MSTSKLDPRLSKFAVPEALRSFRVERGLSRQQGIGPVINPATGKMYGSGLASITAHCLHCKANRKMIDPNENHTGRHYYLLGKCAVCGNKISRPIPDPHGRGQTGGGPISSMIGQVPVLGSILGPIAGMFGLGENEPRIRHKKTKSRKH